jgi:hypothetical protein
MGECATITAPVMLLDSFFATLAALTLDARTSNFSMSLGSLGPVAFTSSRRVGWPMLVGTFYIAILITRLTALHWRRGTHR